MTSAARMDAQALRENLRARPYLVFVPPFPFSYHRTFLASVPLIFPCPAFLAHPSLSITNFLSSVSALLCVLMQQPLSQYACP